MAGKNAFDLLELRVAQRRDFIAVRRFEAETHHKLCVLPAELNRPQALYLLPVFHAAFRYVFDCVIDPNESYMAGPTTI